MTEEPITLEQMLQTYRRLNAEYQAGQMTHDQYAAALASLQGVDTAGHWWAVQPDGKFWMHNGMQWVPATPAGLVSLPVYARPAAPATPHPAAPLSRPPAQQQPAHRDGFRQIRPKLTNLASKLAEQVGKVGHSLPAPDNASSAVERADQGADETPAPSASSEAVIPQSPVNANPPPVEPVSEVEKMTPQAPSEPAVVPGPEPVVIVPAPLAVEPPQTRPRPWIMSFETGPLKGQRFPLGDKLTIGRALDNDLVLTDTQISRKHAVIERAGEGYQVSDLGSSNGTLVNGVQISQPTALVPEDVVQIGDTLINVLGPAGTAPLSVDVPTQRKPISAATRAHKQRVAAVPTQVTPLPAGPAAAAQQAGRVCPHCGAPLKPGSRFCVKCGRPAALDAGERPAPAVPARLAPEVTPEAAQQAAELHCPNCGEVVRAGLKFCGKCGERL